MTLAWTLLFLFRMTIFSSEKFSSCFIFQTNCLEIYVLILHRNATTLYRSSESFQTHKLRQETVNEFFFIVELGQSWRAELSRSWIVFNFRYFSFSTFLSSINYHQSNSFIAPSLSWKAETWEKSWRYFYMSERTLRRWLRDSHQDCGAAPDCAFQWNYFILQPTRFGSHEHDESPLSSKMVASHREMEEKNNYSKLKLARQSRLNGIINHRRCFERNFR